MIENRGFQYVLYFTALVVIGSTGFYIIGGKSWSVIDSIYMTIITISTVGFSEVHTLLLGTDSKVILIGSSDLLTLFEQNTINEL